MNPHHDDQFVPDGQAGGDGPEAPLFAVPDDASSLGDQAAPAEGSAQERQAGSELEALVAERTADLQRLHAEYVNYKRRVDRDRDLARLKGIETVVTDLLPVLDSIEAAKSHDELEGGFKLVADELHKVVGKYGLEVFGEVGEAFDPTIHEALMHLPLEGEVDVTTISQVMQKGVKLHDRVIRPARVAVADPA